VFLTILMEKMRVFALESLILQFFDLYLQAELEHSNNFLKFN